MVQPGDGQTGDSAFLPDSSPSQIQSTPPYRDRSGGLLAFGIVQMILGALAFLAIPLILATALFSHKIGGERMPLGSYLLPMASYGFAAVVLVTLGVGSIRARRWARALTLIVSGRGYPVGIMMTVFLTVVLPTSFAAAFRRAAGGNSNGNALPTGAVAVILTLIIVLFSIVLVVVPLVFLIFYRTRDVAETVRRRDPIERWTDRCPLPVLGASMIFAWAGLYYLLMSFTTPLVPFFGRYLTGLPGAAGCLIFAALDAYLARALFRLQMTGWWVAVTALALRAISSGITYAHADLLQAYSRMGWKDAQLERLSESPIFRSHLFLWWSIGISLVFLGYLAWTKRFFRLPPSAAAELSTSTVP